MQFLYVKTVKTQAKLFAWLCYKHFLKFFVSNQAWFLVFEVINYLIVHLFIYLHSTFDVALFLAFFRTHCDIANGVLIGFLFVQISIQPTIIVWISFRHLLSNVKIKSKHSLKVCSKVYKEFSSTGFHTFQNIKSNFFWSVHLPISLDISNFGWVDQGLTQVRLVLSRLILLESFN